MHAKPVVTATVAKPQPVRGAALVQRKCACGESAGVTGECSECSERRRLRLQPKLRVNAAGDPYEQQADRAAERVMRMADPTVEGRAPLRLQRLAAGEMGATVAPALVDEVIASPGEPLDANARAFFEPRFGHDFGRVRVHTDARATESARAVNAWAYTVGPHVVFAAGKYAPSEEAGRRLLAHELTHVVQQAEPPSSPRPAGIPLALQPAPRSVQRFQFDEDCSESLRKKITDGHALAERATQRASDVLQTQPSDRLKGWFDFLFGPKGESERAQIASNFATLNSALKQDYIYHCPPQGPEPCNAPEARVLDKDNVAICEAKMGSFSREGMARLLVHENVRRAQGNRSVTDISNTATGECVMSMSKARYVEATTDANHPIPYSCFAEQVIAIQLEEKKKELEALFQKLWTGQPFPSYWTGTMTIDDAKGSLTVDVSLNVRLVDLDFVVFGKYWYRHPQYGDVEGEIPFGIVRFTRPVGEAEGFVITFDWQEGGASGRGYWKAMSADKLEGRWGRGESIKNGGSWTLQPKT